MDPRLPGVPSHEIFYYISAYWFSYKWFNPWKYHIHVLKIHSHFCINFLPKCEETKLKRAAPWNTILYSHNVHDFPLYVVLSIHTIGLYLCPQKGCFLILSNQYFLSIIQPNAIIFSSNSIECDFLLKFNQIQHIHLKFDQMWFSLGIQPNPTFSWNSTKCDFLLEFNRIQHSLEIRPNVIFSWNSIKSKISVGIQPNCSFVNWNSTKSKFFSWNLTEWYYSWSDGIHVEPIFVSH